MTSAIGFSSTNAIFYRNAGRHHRHGLRGGVNRRAGARKGRGYRGPRRWRSLTASGRLLCDVLLWHVTFFESRSNVQVLWKPMRRYSSSRRIV